MAGRIRKTGRQSAEKWNRNLKGAGQSIREGVESVAEAPGIAAAAAADKMQANLLAAISSGKWGRRVAAVSLADWKSATVDKGIPRIAAGADAAMGKTENALNQIIAHADRGLDDLERMPNLTLEDNIQRMVAFTRHMAELEVER